MSNIPSDADLTACYREANGEATGKAQPLTTQRIFTAMRAAISRFGTPPPVVREPLTDDQLREAAKHYCIHVNQTRAFIIGAHFAELTHGITQKGGS